MVVDPLKTTKKAAGSIFLGFVGVILGILGMFLFVILGAVMGGLTGYVVELTPDLGQSVKTGFSSVFGVEDPDLVAIGAMFGFIAGFFKHWASGAEGHAGRHAVAR